MLSIQEKFLYLFGEVPTDDVAAWRAGWYERPEPKDLGDFGRRSPRFDEWLQEPDATKRFNAILEFVQLSNGPTAWINTSSAVEPLPEAAATSAPLPKCG